MCEYHRCERNNTLHRNNTWHRVSNAAVPQQIWQRGEEKNHPSTYIKLMHLVWYSTIPNTVVSANIPPLTL